MLQEGDLEFNFDKAITAIKFDDDDMHKGNSLKAVDFIVEFDDCYHFIEVKDPDDPKAVDNEAFLKKLKSGKLICSLAGKYRDSLFFRNHQNVTEKQIIYVVLLSMAILDDALLLAKRDQLLNSIPLRHHSWNCNSVKDCNILNMKQWKRIYGNDSIVRISKKN